MTSLPRWQQRLQNYQKANAKLKDAIAITSQRQLTDLEKQGLIQAFEFTHELAWNLLKDYLIYQGASQITGSRDAFREAYQAGLIKDGERWMETIVSRNKTSHTYNEAVAEDIVNQIIKHYGQLFNELELSMLQLANGPS